LGVTTTAARSKQKLRGTSRAEIIDISRAIIEDEGVEQLTIRRIAETVNRTQPAVYQHFASKDAILEAVVIDGFAALAERLQRAASRGDKMPLATVATAYVRFGLERRRLYDLMFVGPPAIRFAAGAATPMSAHTAFDILATAVAAAGVATDRIGTLTEVVWASLHGLVSLTISERLRPGRAFQHARLEHLISMIVAITAQT
jgi:AcrR family transcriptional regulator